MDSKQRKFKPSTPPTDSDNFDPLSGYAQGASQSTKSRPHATSSRSAQSRGSNSNSIPRAGPNGPSTTRETRTYVEAESTSSARRRSSATGIPSMRVPLSPPRDPQMFATHEEWKQHQGEEAEGFSHYIPLLIVTIPTLGATIHGRVENWVDGMLLLLTGFYLFQLVSVPWGIYQASHGRHVFEASLAVPSNITAAEDSAAAKRREISVNALRRNELFALASMFIVPFLGTQLLHYVKKIMHDPDHYLNDSMITIFLLVTYMRPLFLLVRLLKANSLYHQEAVHYPSTEVHNLRCRLDLFEKDFYSFVSAAATKEDVRDLRDGVDIPLDQLSKAMNHFNRKEMDLRSTSQVRFSNLESSVQRALRDADKNALIIAQLREEQQRLSRPISAALHLIRACLGSSSHDKTTKAVKWYEHGPFWFITWPVTIPSRAIEWVAPKVVNDPETEEHGHTL